MAEPMLKAHYAYARGVDPAAIAYAIRRGLIRETPDGKVADPDEADAVWYRRHLQRQADQQAGRLSGAEGEARREQALIKSTGAKIVLTRRRVEQTTEATIERAAYERELGAAALEAWEQAATASTLEGGIVEAIVDDLGDLQAEALRVTQ